MGETMIKVDKCSISDAFIQSFASAKEFSEYCISNGIGFNHLQAKERDLKFKEMYKIAVPNTKKVEKDVIK
jgi:hypothetical protein